MSYSDEDSEDNDFAPIETHDFEPIEVCVECTYTLVNCLCDKETEFEPLDECSVCGNPEDDEEHGELD